MTILPISQCGDHRTGGLEGITVAEIIRKLGIFPNVQDDPYKVAHSWGFTVDGKRCAVWDYKGSEQHGSFSTFGPHDVLRSVFGARYQG